MQSMMNLKRDIYQNCEQTCQRGTLLRFVWSVDYSNDDLHHHQSTEKKNIYLLLLEVAILR